METLQTTLNESNEENKTSSQTALKQHLHSSKSTWDDDIFRVRTLEECEAIFSEYCEERVGQLRKSRGDNLSVLRSCCELLTRLEGTIYDAFAGRVLIFLAKYLTFYDRSGLNLKYEFASYEVPDSVKENLKRIDEATEAKLKKISQATGRDIEEGETLSDEEDNVDDNTHAALTTTATTTSTTTTANPSTIAATTHHQQNQIDSEKLYERFWKVQMLLNRPDQLYDKNTWFLFRCMVDSLVLHFETSPAVYRIWKLNGFYMTEPRIFNLQLRDIYMRRSFLLQVLLIMDFLDSRAEAKPESPRLDNAQFAWIRACSARIMDLIGGMPNKKEGYSFMAFVTQIIRDEVHWCRWKNERCAEPKGITRDPDEIINMGSTYHKRRKISDELKSAKPYNMHVIGGPDMSRLWNRRAPQPQGPPDVTRYFNQPQEKQMESFKDPNTSFRILRLLRKSPYFFVPAASVIQSLDGYLKALADKHFNGGTSGGGSAIVPVGVSATASSGGGGGGGGPSSQLSTSKGTTPSATPTPTSNSAESTPNDTNNISIPITNTTAKINNNNLTPTSPTDRDQVQ